MKQIPLTQGKVALVDDKDFDFLNQWKWYAAKHRDTFYAVRMLPKSENPNRPIIKMHRLILGLSDSKIVVDHRDMDGLNNQRSNIRPANTSENNSNTKSYKNSSSKYKGVTKRTYFINGAKYVYYVARIRKNYKLFYVGHFKNEAEAAAAYNKAAIKIHGEFARINQIAI